MGSISDRNTAYRSGPRSVIRTITALLVCSALLICASGCGKSNKRAQEGIKLADGRTLMIGAPLNETPFEGLLERQESNSCIGSGTDVNYRYENFSITAYPDGSGGHFVGMIKIEGSGVETVSGLRKGMSRADAEKQCDCEYSAEMGALVYAPKGGGAVLSAFLDREGSIDWIVIVYESPGN